MSEADAQREAALDAWDTAAAGWGRQRDDFARQGAPVTNWMLDAADLAAGQRVLDLAGGPGELGLAAAPRVLPGGSVVCSDQSEKMVELARAQGEALGLTNVEYRVIDAEWIDMELASVDVVLCRWGYMLMVDPAAAMRETRRVLRSEGRLVLAVWDDREANPWSLIPNAVLVEHGLAQPPAPGTPGPFALGDRALVQEMLEEAGFTEVEIDTVELARVTPPTSTAGGRSILTSRPPRSPPSRPQTNVRPRPLRPICASALLPTRRRTARSRCPVGRSSPARRPERRTVACGP